MERYPKIGGSTLCMNDMMSMGIEEITLGPLLVHTVHI